MEKVYSAIYTLIDKFVISIPATTEFEKGFCLALLLAALIFLLLFLLCLILKLIFRKPAVPGIVLDREDGDIFISRNAIFTAVCRLEYSFPELEILKVKLYRKRGGEFGLKINVMFSARKDSFDTLVADFKNQLFAMLNKTFGIESIKSVEVNLAKLSESGDDECGDSGDATHPAVPHAFISGV